MSKPVIASRRPVLVEPEPGIHAWCACGRSKNPPWCDGSHAGTGITPVRFETGRRSGKLWLCGCKQTKTPPFCDGSHNRLPPDAGPAPTGPTESDK